MATAKALPRARELENFKRELDTWEGDLRPLRELWAELWRRWFPQAPETSSAAPSVRDAREQAFISKVRIPYEFHAVETILPRVVGQDPSMSFKAADSNEDAPVAAIQGGLSTWQMERMGFEYEIRNFARQGLVTGYTVAKVGWIQVQKDVVFTESGDHFEPLLNSMFKVENDVMRTVKVRNDPFFETVNVNDFVWPVRARNLDDASAVWQRRFVSKRYVLEMEEAGVYKNLVDGKKLSEALKGADDSGRLRDAQRERMEDQNLNVSLGEDFVDDDDITIEIWERWTDDRLVTIASPGGDTVWLRDDPNIFHHGKKPFVDWAPIPHPFQLNGLGIMHILYDQAESLDTLRRQMHDSLTYSLNPAFKGTEGLGQEQLVLFPGKYVEVDDLNDITPLIQPTVDWSGAWRMEQEIKSDMQRTSGAFEYLAGGTGEGTSQQTATGVATITNEGNKRVAEMIKCLNERALIRFGHLLAAMNAQFIEETIAVDFTHDSNAQAAWSAYAKANDIKETPEGKLVNVTPEMLETKGRLQPIPEIGADKQVNDIQKRSDATQVITALSPMMADPRSGVDPKALTNYVLEQFGVPKGERDKILAGQMPGASIPPEMLQLIEQNPDILQMIQAVMQSPPAQNGGSDGGPSGENRPDGGVVGAPGAAGPSGPSGQSQQ